MKRNVIVIVGLAALLAFAFTTVALAGVTHQDAPAKALVQVVRDATEPYKDVAAAEAAGYGLFHGCVSGPQEGAMGVHLVNGALVGDGALDAAQPEALRARLAPFEVPDYFVNVGADELLAVLL